MGGTGSCGVKLIKEKGRWTERSGQAKRVHSVNVRSRACVFASMSAGGQAGKSCAECLSLDASWQGVSPPAVVSNMCA